MSGLVSDEVAEDYKNSLEDLTINSRWEIGNLTVIAKENMDHAQAISRVIENHIKSTPPNRKLPALYLLDSVVKNVGTPYTIYFARNLYETFMSAYSLVDPSVRRKLEEMLKTWKEPVPGSLSSIPVFPPEVTRSIDNALIKARTAALQMQQQQARNDPLGRGRGAVPITTAPIPYRNTPTPPVPSARYVLPQTSQSYTSQTNGNAVAALHSSGQPTSRTFPNPLAAPNYQQPATFSQPSVSIDSLLNDIAKLIDTTKSEFVVNYYDEGIRQRLKALLDLQSILQNQQLPLDQLRMIKDQVAQLSPPPVISAPPASTHPQSSTQPASLQTMFPPNALAALLASTSIPQQPTPPPPQLALPVAQPALPFPQPAIAATQGAPAPENSLLASLRAAGMLPPPPSSSTAPTILPANLPFPFPFPPAHPGTPPTISSSIAQSSKTAFSNDVQMTSASLKIHRPHLITLLYEARPNQCATCGRRFPNTDAGREKKAAHLDWHFKVNQRMTEAVRRGQNRSWYVDEMEWIKSRDDDDEANIQSYSGASATSNTVTGLVSSATTKDPKKQYIPVPNDPALAGVNCTICQEKFETVWHDQAQEWVWMDAVKLGGKVYHASCYAEASKDGAGLLRGATPERVLGKRKAEDIDSGTLKTKIKKEV